MMKEKIFLIPSSLNLSTLKIPRTLSISNSLSYKNKTTFKWRQSPFSTSLIVKQLNSSMFYQQHLQLSSLPPSFRSNSRKESQKCPMLCKTISIFKNNLKKQKKLDSLPLVRWLSTLNPIQAFQRILTLEQYQQNESCNHQAQNTTKCIKKQNQLFGIVQQ